MIKQYIIKQICLKNIISKLNELEKLKHTTMSDQQLAFFEKIDNPTSNYIKKLRTGGTIWNVRNVIDEPVEQLYKKQKQGIKGLSSDTYDNQEVSRNLVRLTEWIYDIKN
jgi:hypothetical protein